MGDRFFGVAAETTWGTAVTAGTNWFEALTESVQVEPANESLEVIRGFSVRQVNKLNEVVRGDVEMLGEYGEVGLLFEHLLGSVTTTTGASLNTHGFPATTGIPAADRIGKSLTLFFQRDNQLYFRYAGCKPTGFVHNFGTDQSSRMTWTFLGASASTSTTSNDYGGATSFPATLTPILPLHTTVTIDNGSTLPARNCTITVENPLDEFFTLGSTTLAFEPDRSGPLKVTGSAEIAFQNLTDFYNAFANASDVDFDVNSTNGTSYSLNYAMPKCRILQATPHNSGRDRLVATVEWESYYDSDANENFKVILENQDSAP